MKIPEKIAIVGIGGVFPGARNLDEFWTSILEGRDCSVDVQSDRWRLSPEDLYSAQLAPDKVNSRRACLIEGFEFDSTGLAIDEELLQQLDPMYQLLLHAGRDAWADANTEKVNKKKVGVIIGNIVLPTESSSTFSDDIFKPLFEQQLGISSDTTESKTHALNRYVAGLPGGLLAQALGLGAGAYTLDAACASSLYSLKYAIDELLSGRRDAMLAGGVSRPDCLYTQMGFSQLNAISKSGRCSPFDSKADGLVVGEGAGIFVLKRLSDAIENSDHVYATIEGIGLSNDIEGNIMSPDTEGQLRAMQSAYQKTGWSPGDVQHIECHGTGTPVGDAVEFNSLTQLWQQHKANGECVIGSVKSNVGHLLTAAGAAALMKTLLAMKHKVLPATANYESPSNTIDIVNSPFKVLNQSEEWQTESGKPRRAAISGFGFGGINAHVLLQEYENDTSSSVISSNSSLNANDIDIAIVGMETRLGPWNDQTSFNEATLFGADKKPAKPQHGWGDTSIKQDGYAINDIDIPLGRYRIPPAELKEMLPQQLLMLEVAANALNDAGLSELSVEQQCRTGVFVGIALDLNTTNFHFRWMQKRYARQWLSKLGIELSDTDFNQWLDNLRTATGPALNANRTMGALGGIVASRIARSFRVGGPSFTISGEETSGLRALESGMRALQQHELDQAIIGAVDLANDLRAVKGQTELKQLDCIADGATAFILKRHDDAVRDGDEVYAIIKGIGAASNSEVAKAQQLSIQQACEDAQYKLDDIDHTIFASDDTEYDLSKLSNKTTNRFPLGHSGAANGLMAVASAVSSLHKRMLPADDQQAARYWLKDRIAGPRRTLVNSSSIDGNSVSVVLEQADADIEGKQQDKKLFAVAADDEQQLVEKLQSLRFEHIVNDASGNYRVAILAKDESQFNLACKEAITAINNKQSIDNGHCFYSTERLAEAGKLAFVYPGSGNHFWGMGQELGVAFPEVLEELHEENDRLASQFANGRFWQGDDGKELSHEEVIFGQVWLGTFVSDVVSRFNIKPGAVIGYSLGETAGFFSTRTWTARDEMLERIQQSTLFTDELAGPCTSVQKAWGTDETIDWALGVINVSADEVKKAIANYPKVYLLIINTPNECVIGGDKTQLNQVVQELNVQYHPLSGVTTVHCEVAKPVAEAYRNLHIFETTPPADVAFYSGIRGGAYEVDRDTAADSILDQALACFDYTKVINNAYEDGVRLFIEMGPGGSCSRMIDLTLTDRPHYTKAICVKGQNSLDNLMQLLARLYAEGLNIDLSSVIQQAVKQEQQHKNAINIRVGGEPFQVPKPPQPIKKQANVVSLKQTETIREASSVEASPVPLAVNYGLQPIIEQMQRAEQAKAKTQETFLRVSQGMTDTLAQAINMQMQLLSGSEASVAYDTFSSNTLFESRTSQEKQTKDCQFDRDACMEFATGSIGKMLGDQFADIDSFPTRVRLPDEPLMLVDRILELDGEADVLTKQSNASGRVVTEHDIHPNAWYLDQGRIPTCIAVESGQADLFLSGFLGIDHITRGDAVYRLLDARITFHGPLPKANETIRYDIHIDEFFRQGDTWLFRFNFEGTVVNRDVDGRVELGTETENGQPLLTMTHGCAGFFTQQELDAGQGIILTSMETQQQEGQFTGGWQSLVSMKKESFSDEQLNALRRNDLGNCFGGPFNKLNMTRPAGLPWGRMTLVHRILDLDPAGGRYGIGQITGEADIHADDWFLTCHFVDDRVMPGTLMYECCLHTLRVYLLRMGWVGNVDEFVYEPIIGEVSQLKCRGQVTENTSAVQYEITLKEIGYQADGTPYVKADALMYADHRPVVQMKNMSVQLTGLTKQQLESRWQNQNLSQLQQVIFDNQSILDFAEGNPSDAFGDKYKVFDQGRKIARLPRPPYKFLDRIVSIKDCEQWVLKAGGIIEAEYDIPADEWYFAEDNQPYMPFAVLLEVALQPCGWLAAYLGSALTSDIDLSFRNLGGKAEQFLRVTPETGTLTTRVKITNVSQSGGMIIQNFDYEMHCADGVVYKGDTYFGFFSAQALADQIGIREAELFKPESSERESGESFVYPDHAQLPNEMMRMVDEISLYLPKGGRNNLGYIEGIANVDQDDWFFKAHFYQDPVWPGSLGLESFLQILKVFAVRRWEEELTDINYDFESIALNHKHEWIYRGQILPTDSKVTVQAVITQIDDVTRTLTADGFLSVDGRIIYQMKDFALRIHTL